MMPKVPLIALLMIVAGSSVPGAAYTKPGEGQPVYREIGDWIVGCDNTRDCVAKLVPDDDTAASGAYDATVAFVISRAAGPTGEIDLELTAETPFDPHDVSIAGGPLTVGLGWQRDDDGKTARLTGVSAVRFLRAIRNARALTLSRNRDARAVSLRGLAGVLLTIDDLQGRIGNTSALARPGPLSAAKTPPAIAAPAEKRAPPARPLANAGDLARRVRASQTAVLKAHECDPDTASDDTADPLNEREAIVLIGCGRFAYQGSVLAFIVPRDAPARGRLLILSKMLPVRANLGEDGEYIGGSFDLGTVTLSALAKGRALADCGSSADWTYDGTAFRLSALSMQQRCGGRDDDDWPVLYRTRRSGGATAALNAR